MGKGEGGIKYVIFLLFSSLASLIDGKVVGGVISEKRSPHREMEFDFAIVEIRQDDVQTEIPERLGRMREKYSKEMQEFESLAWRWRWHMKARMRMKFKEGMVWREQKTGGRELQRLSLCLREIRRER